MKRFSLKVEKRKILGKKVKKLRKDGIIPGNIYGKDIKSTAIQAPFKEFMKVFKEAGETGLVDVALDSQVIPALIHNVATNYRNDVLHADFFKVNLKEKVKAMVHVEFAGEPKAVIDKTGLLMHILSEVEVEALPTDLPEKIEVDVSHLANVDEQIEVSQLKVAGGVSILSDPTQVVAKIGELVTKEAAEQAAEEAAAAAEAAAESAAEAGVPAEGEEVPPAEGEAEAPAPAEGVATEGSEKSTETQSKPKAEEKPQA